MQNEFTGRHMLLCMIGFFGVIIAVNLVLATFAGTSWTGLVVKSSYVASQDFNKRIATNDIQAERGWRADVHIDGARLRYRMTDTNGNAVIPDQVSVVMSRPTHENDDRTFILRSSEDGAFVSSDLAAPGLWNLKITSTMADGIRDTRVFRVTVPR